MLYWCLEGSALGLIFYPFHLYADINIYLQSQVKIKEMLFLTCKMNSEKDTTKIQQDMTG